MWNTVAYCMSCDARVPVSATDCHKCGQSFRPSIDAEEAAILDGTSSVYA